MKKRWFATVTAVVIPAVALLAVLWTIGANGSQPVLAADVPSVAPGVSEVSPPSAPEGAVSLAPVYVLDPELYIDPPNAQAYAHYIFLYQVTRSVPKESTLYVKFPQEQYDPNGDGLWDDSRIPNLTYDPGDLNLDKMLVSWAATRDDVFDSTDYTNIPAPVVSDSPFRSFAWRDPLVSWLEDGEVRLAIPTADLPEGYWVRVDFWGPPTAKSGEMDAGISNPGEQGNYCWYVATDEEVNFVEVCVDITTPTLEPVKEVNLDYAAPGNTLEYTIHIVNEGLTTTAHLTDVILSVLDHVPDSEWASSGEVWFDPDEDAINWFGEVPASGEVQISFEATVSRRAAVGQPIVNVAWIYDEGTGEEYELDVTTIVSTPFTGYDNAGWLPIDSCLFWECQWYECADPCEETLCPCDYGGLECPQVTEVRFTGDPVNLINGNLVHQIEDVRVKRGILPLHFQRTYNSLSSVPGPFGYGWTHPYNTWLSIEPPDGPRVYLYAHDGAVFQFDRNPDGSYSPPDGIHRTLTRVDDTWTLRYRNGLVQHFETVTSTITGGPVGRLTVIGDRHGNQVTLSYDANGDLTTITDSTGRTISLTYSAGRITQLTDPLGRAFAYQYSGGGDLVGVAYPDGAQAIYTYTAHLMTYRDDPWAPRGMAVVTYTYDTSSRVVRLDFLTGTQEIAYYAATTVFTDALGHTRIVPHDDQTNIPTVTDALGGVTGYTYDADHNITSRTDANGHTTTYTYDANGNLTSITDPLGHTTFYTYDLTYNRLTQVTNPLSRTTTYTYDANGNLLSVTDPMSGVTSYAYDGCCLPTVITDVNGHTTHYGYDGVGNLVVITDALGYTTVYTHDALGRRLSRTDVNGHTTGYAYDAASRVLTVTA